MVEVQAVERPSDIPRQDLTPDQHYQGDLSFQDRLPRVHTYPDPLSEDGAEATPRISRGLSTEEPNWCLGSIFQVCSPFRPAPRHLHRAPQLQALPSLSPLDNRVQKLQARHRLLRHLLNHLPASRSQKMGKCPMRKARPQPPPGRREGESPITPTRNQMRGAARALNADGIGMGLAIARDTRVISIGINIGIRWQSDCHRSRPTTSTGRTTAVTRDLFRINQGSWTG